MQVRRQQETLLLGSVLFPLLAFAFAFGQQPSGHDDKQDRLILELVDASKNDPSSGTAFLNRHRELITPLSWRRLIDIAESRPANTPAIYECALLIANELHDERLVATTHYKSGWYHFGQGNISIAIEAYQRSKKAFERAGLRRDLIYVLADLGTLYLYASDYRSAKDYSEQSIALADQLRGSTEPLAAWPDEYGLGAALLNLGNISKRDGEYLRAVDYFQKSLTLYEKLNAAGGRYSADIVDDLADIGRAYLAMGDNLHALTYLDKAMGVAKASHNANRIASICNSLGILYTNQRDYPKAIDFFKQGLELANQRNDRFKQASMLLNMGVAYQFQGEYNQALKNFLVSLEIAKAIGDKETIIALGEGVGTVYKEQGRYKEAIDSLNQSLVLAEAVENRTRIAELLWRKSEVLLASGNSAESIQSASEAAKLAEQLSLNNVRYLALTTLGKGQRASRQEQLAAQTFSTAIDHIESLRAQVAGAVQEQQLFFEDKVAPYHQMLDLLVNRKTPDSGAEALLYAERAKGRVLLDVLRHGKIDFQKSMNEQEKEEERKLNRAIVTLNVRLSEESSKKASDVTLLKTLNEDLKLARLKYETFQDSLSASHPELRARPAETPALTLNDVTGLVRDDNTAFVEYVVTSDKTYLFVLTKKKSTGSLDLGVYPINTVAKELAKRVDEFREMLAGRDPTFAATSRELYDLLIKPGERQLQGKDTLCLVPDGVLWDLPFQALQSKPGQYLLQDYAVNYAPSLGVLRQMEKKQQAARTASTSLLAFGNPQLGSEVAMNLKAVYRGESLAPLPEAETEVKALKDIWGGDHSRILVGANASKQLFKAEASKYQIIHLATHGILDDGNPMYSRLAMARAENDPDDDGLLEAREIMQLNLHADLAVLSACQTARGRIGAGEGVIGMSWAFFVAGVPTIVVSQWKVDSTSTTRLMINFHDHLRNGKGMSNAQALRQSSLELLKDKRYQHPFYWAAFVLVGRD